MFDDGVAGSAMDGGGGSSRVAILSREESFNGKQRFRKV